MTNAGSAEGVNPGAITPEGERPKWTVRRSVSWTETRTKKEFFSADSDPKPVEQSVTNTIVHCKGPEGQDLYQLAQRATDTVKPVEDDNPFLNAVNTGKVQPADFDPTFNTLRLDRLASTLNEQRAVFDGLPAAEQEHIRAEVVGRTSDARFPDLLTQMHWERVLEQRLATPPSLSGSVDHPYLPNATPNLNPLEPPAQTLTPSIPSTPTPTPTSDGPTN